MRQKQKRQEKQDLEEEKIELLDAHQHVFIRLFCLLVLRVQSTPTQVITLSSPYLYAPPPNMHAHAHAHAHARTHARTHAHMHAHAHAHADSLTRGVSTKMVNTKMVNTKMGELREMS